MSVSDEAKRRLEVAVTSKAVAEELVAAINAPGSGPAVVVAGFGVTTNLPAANCAGGAAPTAVQVNAAIDAVSATAEARIDALEAKVNELLTALKNASYMATA